MTRLNRPILIILLWISAQVTLGAQEYGAMRFSLGPANGGYSYISNDALNRDFDHDLKGGAVGVSYYIPNKRNVLFGGGIQFVNVSGTKTSSSESRPGNWTYYSQNFGYFDVYVTVSRFSSTFFYGLVGYQFGPLDKLKIQPNLRLGVKSISVNWSIYLDSESYPNFLNEYKESETQPGIEIQIPIIYEINDVINLGLDLCICGTYTRYYDSSSEEIFYSTNVFNLLFDLKF